MTINSWKTGFIGFNKPPRVITGYAQSSVNLEYWPYQLGDDDPYWSGGTNPIPYRYRVTFRFSDQTHGSNLTRTPYSFNAQDIEVGDFVAGADDGKVLQVMSVISKTDYELVAIIEDRLRYNVYKTGTSCFSVPGNVVFFQINNLGLPMLDPLPALVSPAFYANVTSRFQYVNPLTNYILEKENHGFVKGDTISIESGEFVKSSTNNITRFMGTVVESGPGPNQFILRPATGIIDFIPSLPGDVGDYVYPDGSGGLTLDDSSKRPLYMKIADSEPSYTIGSGINPTGTDGNIVEINKVQVTLSSGTGTFNLDQAIADINVLTPTHGVVADKVNTASSAVTADSNLIYGVIAGYTPFSASINGVTINFTTTTNGSVMFGSSNVANVNDIVTDINQANIPNILADINNDGKLVLTNEIGGAITIVNISNDTNGRAFAGNNSITGLTLTTPANTTNYALRLTRDDGGPMTLKDATGLFFYNAGIISGQNGHYALGLQIDQGIRSSVTTVVPTLAARNSLQALVGDQSYVLDDGNGEWALFVWDGSNWISVATERSNANDARTVVTTFDLNSLGTGTTEHSLGYATAGRTVTEVAVLVTAPCPADSTITVGTSSTTDILFAAQDARLYETGMYSTDPEYQTGSYEELVAELTLPTVGTGQVTVIINYS